MTDHIYQAAHGKINKFYCMIVIAEICFKGTIFELFSTSIVIIFDSEIEDIGR